MVKIKIQWCWNCGACCIYHIRDIDRQPFQKGGMGCVAGDTEKSLEGNWVVPDQTSKVHAFCKPLWRKTAGCSKSGVVTSSGQLNKRVCNACHPEGCPKHFNLDVISGTLLLIMSFNNYFLSDLTLSGLCCMCLRFRCHSFIISK